MENFRRVMLDYLGLKTEEYKAFRRLQKDTLEGAH